MSLKRYAVDRLKERDTHAVLGGAVYTIARALMPPQYGLALDMLAGLIGSWFVASPTPVRK
jgi:hypothetical protein